MRALIVDDSRTMRMILKKQLTQLGFAEVFEAGDGIEALGVLDGIAAPDVVLVDWNMPNMTGIDLVTAVRKNAAWNAMKVVMVTTASDLVHVQAALGQGANEYVLKPFTPQMLSEKLTMIGVAA
ncbi:MAG: response regulator [Deltaproteobacteria bacterium]